MKSVLHWIKGNPILVVASVMALASLVTLIVVHMQAGSFVEQVQKRSQTIGQVKSLLNTNVQVPSSNIDDLPRSERITVNENAIRELEHAYGRMNQEYSSIFGLAVKMNHAGHEPMIEGLFPDPGTESYRLYDVRNRYRQAFEEFFKPVAVGAIYPRLNAGGPVAADTVRAELQRVELDYLNSFFPPRANRSALTQPELQELQQKLRSEAVATLRRHAERYHVFAETSPGAAGYPFQIGEWSKPGPLPNMTQIWGGQMGLWVQQDIVTAIGVANGVSDPNQNVTIAPVKRLLAINVVGPAGGTRSDMPGYVGINSGGGLSASGGSGGTVVSAEQKLPDDFSKAPTGRRSNTIYDVIHVRVAVHVDYQRLPEFLEALAKTNFMSVLRIQVAAVDEYALLSSGYFYGTGDVVEAQMLIETLWLREWTQRLMPEGVRKLLGIAEVAAEGAVVPGA